MFSIQRCHPRHQRGVTLVELLVVVTIAVVLLAASIPMMQPVIKGREVREATREIQAFIKAAEVRAMERGRPVGVAFLRSDKSPNLVYQLALAEVPPPYMGDSSDARALVLNIDLTSGQCRASLSASLNALEYVNPGDRIRFDFRGPSYRVASKPSGQYLMFHLDGSLPPPKGQLGVSTGVPFQIFRQPRITAAAPLELPVPAAIDLSMSGIGAQGFQFNGYTEPVVMTFRPQGGLDRIYTGGNGSDPLRTLEPLFLLIGRADQVGEANINDNRSQWMSITRVGAMHMLQNETPQVGGMTVDAKVAAIRTNMRKKWMTAGSS